MLEGGTNIDNWTFEGLIECVTEFTTHYGRQNTMEDNDDKDNDNADDKVGEDQYANDTSPSPGNSKDTDDDAFVDISKDAHDY